LEPNGQEQEQAYVNPSISKGGVGDDLLEDETGLPIGIIVFLLAGVLGFLYFVKGRSGNSPRDSMRAGYRPVPGAGTKTHSK
jgi:hypothetical protein